MILTIIIFFITTIAIVYWITKDTNKRIDSYMSFRESMDLTELPVVTFYQGDKKINFLLDTGSNNSLINAYCGLDIEFNGTNTESEIYGINGEKIMAKCAKIKFSYKDFKFDYNFQVCDLSNTFEAIKKETGVNIHGILGNQFFKEYSYILDFNKLVAYSKK